MTNSALTVDVDAARVRAAFGALRVLLDSGLAGAWEDVGERMEDAAIPFVPVETARLVDDLKADAGPDGAELSSDLVYAGVQNFGWPAHGIEGHHFMERAEDETPRAAIEELSPAIQGLIDRVGLR